MYPVPPRPALSMLTVRDSLQKVVVLLLLTPLMVGVPGSGGAESKTSSPMGTCASSKAPTLAPPLKLLSRGTWGALGAC